MNQHDLDLIGQGADAWNAHRRETGKSADLAGAVVGDLRLCKADLSQSNFEGASLGSVQANRVDFTGANFRNAFCPESNFSGCNFSNADRRGAKFFRSTLDAVNLEGARFDSETDLSMCNLALAKLRGVNASGVTFSFSSLSAADLRHADLSGADLTQTNLVHADVTGATFAGARIHGIAAWDLQGRPVDESNLIISKPGDSVVTVDDLEVAQFVNLMLNNAKMRDLIDTVTTKTVLILGRFKEARKQILDTIRERLRKENYVGVIFDFDPSPNRNLTETVSTLAHMSRFIIADITEPRSIPYELKHVVPLLPSVPVQPLVHRSDAEWAMFDDLRSTGTILPTFTYNSLSDILHEFRENLIQPAERWLEKKAALPLEEQLINLQRQLAASQAENERLRRRIEANESGKNAGS